MFFVEKGKTSRSQEIDDKRLHKELGSSDKTGKPVILSEDIRVMHAHDGTGEHVNTIECSYPSGTLPAYCIPKVVRLETGEVLYERPYVSPRPPPKISLRHDHDWTRGNDQLGSTVEQQPVGKIVQQSCGEVQHAKFSNPTQQNPNQSVIDR